MVLRLAIVPAARSVEALDDHVAALQATGRPVLLVSARYPADFLVPRLLRADPSRLAVIDACSPTPPRAVPGVHTDHVAGPHLVELLRLRARRVMERVLREPAHVVYHDVEAVARVLPLDIAVQLARDIARSSRPGTWTDLVVPDAWAMPAALRAVCDEVVPDRIKVQVGATAQRAGALETSLA